MHEEHLHGSVPPPTPEEISRRRFLSYFTGLLAGIMTLMLGIPLVGYVIAPLLKKVPESWVKLGPVADLIPNEPVRFTYSYQRVDGWFERTVHNNAYGIRLDGPSGEILVLSNICTHLGCGVRWDDSRKAFLCPCHNAVFDIEGKVVSGPPPRPLNRLNYQVRGGEILVRIEEV